MDHEVWSLKQQHIVLYHFLDLEFALESHGQYLLQWGSLQARQECGHASNTETVLQIRNKVRKMQYQFTQRIFSKRWTKSLFLLYHFTLESWKIFFVHFSPSKLRMQSEIEPPLKPTSQNRYVPLLCVHLTYLPNCAIQQIKYNFPIYQKISGLRPYNYKGPLILDHIFVLSLVQ